MTEYLITSKERSVMYQLLASFYLQTPTLERIKLEYDMLLYANEIFLDVNFDNLIEEAKERLQKINENADFIEQIKLEFYDHIFTQISSKYIPPYESSIIGARKSQKVSRKNKGGWDYNKSSGATLYNVELAYKTVGFAPNKLNVSEELRATKSDHLGFELAFMAFLNEQEEESKENINWYKLQTLFLKDHLKSFIQKYSEISLDKSKGFYSSLSVVTKDFINWDLCSRERGEIIER